MSCGRCVHVQVDELDLSLLGPQFEKNSVFPAKTNTEFVQVRVSVVGGGGELRA